MGQRRATLKWLSGFSALAACGSVVRQAAAAAEPAPDARPIDPAPADAIRFPTQPVKIIHPYPGGPLDAAVRLVAERLAAGWAQPVIVDPRPGAMESIAADIVAKARPDGHTLLVATEATFVNNPLLFDRLPYDPVRDLDPIGELFAIPFGLIVRGELPAKDIAGFVARARRPGPSLVYASLGVGTGPHLAMEALRRAGDFEILHVPYKSAPQAIQDLVSGQVDALFGSAQIALPHLPSGRMRMLAVTSEARLSIVPDVPTFAEAGYAGAAYRSSVGIALPAGVPAGIADRIRRAMMQTLEDVAIRSRLMTPNGYEFIGSDPPAFAAALERRTASARTLIRALGIRLGS